MYWPTSTVTSTTGLRVDPVALQQFYFLPGLSLNNCSCKISKVKVTPDYPNGDLWIPNISGPDPIYVKLHRSVPLPLRDSFDVEIVFRPRVFTPRGGTIMEVIDFSGEFKKVFMGGDGTITSSFGPTTDVKNIGVVKRHSVYSLYLEDTELLNSLYNEWHIGNGVTSASMAPFGGEILGFKIFNNKTKELLSDLRFVTPGTKPITEEVTDTVNVGRMSPIIGAIIPDFAWTKFTP